MGQFDEFVSKFLEQVAVIRTAPRPFLLSLALLLGAIWFAMDWRYGGIIAAKDSQISLWKDRAEAWEKSGATTPDEIKRILAHRWSALTTEEANDLFVRLRNVPKPTSLFVRCPSSDCLDLADSIIAVFRRLGWEPRDADMPTGFAVTGLVVSQGDGKDTAISDAISGATKGRLAPKTEATSLKSTYLLVGRKP
jgi:hypothetical protein